MHLRIPLLLALPTLALAGDRQAAPALDAPLWVEPTGVAYDTPGDGHLWARGATYKASFGPDGATYIPFLGSDAPRNQPVRLQLKRARVGERAIPLTERATWSRSGDAVTLERGAVDVRYHLSVDAIEQTFLVDEMAPDGDLVVDLEVESELELRADGAGFEPMGERGGVRYGSATVFDADGRSLALESRLEDDGLSIRVPRSFLETARQPIVIDPIITTYAVNAGPTGTWSGDVAYDATHGLFLYAFTLLFSASDYDMYSVPVQLDGTVRHDLGLWIDVSDVKWAHAAVANSNSGDNYLVAAEADYGDETGVFARVRQLPGLDIGPVLNIAGSDRPECFLPSVGGEVVDGVNRYCVVWAEGEQGGDKEIRYRVLESNGADVTGVQVLDASAPNWKARVSNSSGYGNSGERRWNVVWTREVAFQDSDVRGAQIAPNGALVTPPFVVDSTSVDSGHPDVASPLLAPSGGPRDFVAVYTCRIDGQYDLRARLFKGADFLGSYDLGALEAEVIGDDALARDQLWPSVATDGSQLIVAYAEEPVVGTGSDLRLSTFHHNGAGLFVNEAHLLVAAGLDETHTLPELAPAHDAGVPGAPLTAITWSRGDGSDADTLGGFYWRAAGWDPLGEVTCAGMPSSTGHAATFRAYGSSDIDDDRLYLDVDNLPKFQWGQFVMSESTDLLPVADGFLCLGAPHVRLGSTVTNSWVQGAVGVELDLANLPDATVLQPGETWYFQYWYRDGASSNFSNALGVTFD